MREWSSGEAQEEAFKLLKRTLASVPVLARSDFSMMFKVQCDASEIAFGAVLTQDSEDGEHPIVCVSRILTSTEKNYTTTEKECLAMVWTIKKLKPYLEGYKFTVVTDHSALRWLCNLKGPTGWLARWALQLQQWDFDIVHRRDTLHQVLDSLSRVQESEEVEIASFDEITDPWYLTMLEEVGKYPAKLQQWRVEEGRLYRHRSDPLLDLVEHPEEKWRLVVPVEYRERVMQDAHCAPKSGLERSLSRVHTFVRESESCQKYMGFQTEPQGLIGPK